MTEKFNKNSLYPVAEWYGSDMSRFGDSRLTIRAKPTGEYRPPKKGEYFLSGSVIEAYRAPNDLSTSYYIAKLVKAKAIWVEDVNTSAAGGTISTSTRYGTD